MGHEIYEDSQDNHTETEREQHHRSGNCRGNYENENFAEEPIKWNFSGPGKF